MVAVAVESLLLLLLLLVLFLKLTWMFLVSEMIDRGKLRGADGRCRHSHRF